jgi:hypothetical protein
VVEELIRNKGLKSFLLNCFPSRANQAHYNDADLVLGLTYGILCGAEYLEDLNEVKRELDCEYVKIPSSDTIGYRIGQLSVEDEQPKNPRSEVVHQFNCNTFLNETLARLGAWLNPEWKRSPVTVDYDNTIIPTGKDSEATYKKVCGYQPGVGIIDNQPVYVEGRNGNSTSSFKMEETLQRMVHQLEGAGIRVGALRIDAAAFSQNVFKWLYKRPDLKYYLGARKQNIDILRDAKWDTFTWGEVKVQATSIEYPGPGMNELPDHGCRLVVYRQKKKGGQQDLFWGAYQYRFILTNDWQMTARQVVEYYNQRGAAERVFEYLKYDFNWLNMPFGQMNTNTAYLLITAMSYQIYQWVLKKIRYFQGVASTIRPKKFNLYFINVTGKWIRTGRTKYLKLYSSRPYQELFQSG